MYKGADHGWYVQGGNSCILGNLLDIAMNCI